MPDRLYREVNLTREYKGSRGINWDCGTPYELEDLGVIILHASQFPKRWEWFWPRFKQITPPVVLHNTVLVYNCAEQDTIPDDVKEAETQGVTLLKPEIELGNITALTLEGLKICKTRLIARVHNDTGFRFEDWASRVIQLYNIEPHFKILATVVGTGPPYESLKGFLDAPWLHRILRYGDYDWFTFLCGHVIIANRCLWMGYFPSVAEQTPFDREDVLFTLYSRADGVSVIDPSLWKHCGFKRAVDAISESDLLASAGKATVG